MSDAMRARTGEAVSTWTLHPLSRSFRIIVQQTLVWFLVRLAYRVRVRGTEELRGLHGPVLFVANHCLHWDNGILLTTIPLGWRWKLAIAADADDIFGNPVRGVIAGLLGNAFPLSKVRRIRRSLRLLGARLDRRFSVLMYPEGKLTVGGPMQPFKGGAGLVAVEGAVPVVPVKIKIRRMSGVADRRWQFPLRGDVEVVFGAPLFFPRHTPAADATAGLEAAVASL